MTHEADDAGAGSGVEATGEYLTIANEFTTVRVRKVRTRNGERLEIESPKAGHKILLDPLELEALSWQEPGLFSKWLETPFGPENHEH
ncbi:MAG: dihydrodiol dehydrogenase [Microbacteriaceae bacterium]|nr:dihydrodiol dehydrogenase [Microbacteriaceae bacterium]